MIPGLDFMHIISNCHQNIGFHSPAFSFNFYVINRKLLLIITRSKTIPQEQQQICMSTQKIQLPHCHSPEIAEWGSWQIESTQEMGKLPCQAKEVYIFALFIHCWLCLLFFPLPARANIDDNIQFIWFDLFCRNNVWLSLLQTNTNRRRLFLARWMAGCRAQ